MKKLNNVILTILILIEPFLDTYFLYNCGVEIFGFKISTIIRYTLLGALLLLLLIQDRFRNKRMGLIIYFVIFIVYLVLHHVNALNFISLVPGNFDYSLIEELFYISRYFFPLILIYYLNTVPISNNFFKKVIVIFSLIVSISVIFSNIFLLSKSSYYDYNISYNIFDWFVKDISYSTASTRGFFYATIVMTNLLLITPYIYNLYYKEGKYLYLTAIVCNMFALFMAGTKACTLGFIIIAIMMCIIYLFFSVIIKEFKIDLGKLFASITIVIMCFVLLPNSPMTQRFFLTNDMFKNNKNDDNQIITKPDHNSGNSFGDSIIVDDPDSNKYELNEYYDLENINKIEDKKKRKILIKKYIAKNYDNLGITSDLLINSYSFKYDYEFWTNIILNETAEQKADNRNIQTKIFERIKEINSSKMDDLFGLTYSRTSKIFNLERDFLYQYYSLGIVGVLLFLGPLVLLLLVCMIKMLRNRKLLNMENTSLCFGVGLLLCVALYSGNMLDNLGIIIMLGFVEGYLVSNVFFNKTEIKKVKKTKK